MRRQKTDPTISKIVLVEDKDVFRTLFENSVDAQFLSEGDIFIDCNDAALQMMGCSQKDDIVGHQVGESSPRTQPDGRPSVDKAKHMLAATMAKGGHHFDWVHRRRDGTHFPSEVSLTALQLNGRLLVHAVVRDVTNREGSQRALRDSEARFKQLFHSVNDGIALRDAETFELLDANSKFCEMWGYTLEELKQLPLGSLTANTSLEESRTGLIAQYKEAGEGTPKLLQWEGKGKDGSTFWVERNVRRITVGDRGCVLTVARDITERKKVEEALRRSEEAARLLAQETAVMAEIGRIISSSLEIEEIYDRFAEEVRKLIPFDRIVVNLVNPQEGTVTITYVSGVEIEKREKRSVFPLGGAAMEEMVRTQATVLFYPESIEEAPTPGLALACKAGLRSRLLVPLFARGKVIGGLSLWSKQPKAYGEQDIRLTQSVASQIAGAIANARLFHERERAEEALRESEESYRSLVETSPDAIFLHEEGRLIYVNPAAVRLYGAGSAEELYGKDAFDIVHPDDRRAILNRTDFITATGSPVPLKEIRTVRNDGSIVAVEATAGLSCYRGKKVIQVIQRDITERKRAEDELQKERETFFTILESDPTGVALIGQDGVYQYLNPEFTNITGYSLEDIRTGREWFEKAYPDPQYRQTVIDTWKADRLSRGKGVDRGFAVTCKNGQKKEIEFRTTFLKDYTVLVLNDVTERKRSEEALTASEERYRRVVESSPSAIFVDCWNNLVFANPAAARLLGAVEPDQLRGRSLLDFVPVEFKGIMQEHIDSLLQGSQTFLLRSVQLVGLHGGLLHVDITGIAFDYEGEPAVQLVVHDITEARQKAMELEHMANHDALTRLPNRTKMRDRLNQAIAHARRYGRQTTVVFLDLDHFKIINDSLGHDQGDVFLRTIADRLRGCVREVDTVARFGGDEFVIVLFDQPEDNDALMGVLERIQKCVKQPVILAGREYSVSSSIGFAIYPRDGLDAETLLRNADGAMYRAKEQGRDTAQPYAEELYVLITERFKLHNDLRRALEHDEFVVHYQPQANLRSGAIIGVEALVRWRHPERGLIGPGNFIDAAEETGLIAPIGEFVLRTACKQGKTWQDRGLPPLRIAVNLSSRQFWQPNLLDTIEGSLQDSGLNPHVLELELTESLILKGVDGAVRTMQSLRTLGIHLAIDDFGTGYSSLAYLKRFPIGRLKVAQAFLRDIPHDPDSVAIARAVISLGHSLKLKVIAEGVETQEQLHFLEAAGCDEIQGYLLSRPLPEEEITELLTTRLLRVNVGVTEPSNEQCALDQHRRAMFRGTGSH